MPEGSSHFQHHFTRIRYVIFTWPRAGDLRREGERVGVFLRGGLARLHQRPVAADGLADDDLVGLVLVVAERDLPGGLGRAATEDVVVGLLAIADDVEGLAHLDGDLFVARGVIDAVLADELLHPALVRLVDADGALRERHAQVVLLAVLELEEDAHLLVRGDLAVLAAKVAVVAHEHEAALHVEAVALEERHLLGLAREQIGRTFERVEVVLEEALFLEPAAPVVSVLGLGLGRELDVRRGAHALHVAGDELELGVLVRGARLVAQRDPADEIGLGHARVSGFFAHREDVVCLPVEPAAEVADLDLRLRGLALEEPHQAGFGDEVRRELAEAESARNAVRDLVAHAEHRHAVLGGEDLGVDGLFLPGLLVEPVDADGLADALLEQLLRREEIVAVVLLEDREARRRRGSSRGPCWARSPWRRRETRGRRGRRPGPRCAPRGRGRCCCCRP